MMVTKRMSDHAEMKIEECFNEFKPPGPAAPNFKEGAGLPPRPGPMSPPVNPHYRASVLQIHL